jgi:hypothetical protein
MYKFLGLLCFIGLTCQNSRAIVPLLSDSLFVVNIPTSHDHAISHSLNKKSGVNDGSDAFWEKFNVTLQTGVGFSSLYSKKIMDNGQWKIEKGIGYSIGVEMNYFFNKKIGISFGAGLSNYNSGLNAGSFSNATLAQPKMIDKDGDTYYKLIAANVKETNSFTYIDLPLLLKLDLGNTEKISFYLQGGGALSFLVSAKYSSSGSITYSGYYPEYHVVLKDLPDYGFGTSDIKKSNADWVCNSIMIDTRLGGGINIPIDKVLMSVGASMVVGLGDIKYDKSRYEGDYFFLSANPGKVNNRYLGIKVGITF